MALNLCQNSNVRINGQPWYLFSRWNQHWIWIKIRTSGCYMVLHAASNSKYIYYDSQCSSSNWIFSSKYYSIFTSLWFCCSPQTTSYHVHQQSMLVMLVGLLECACIPFGSCDRVIQVWSSNQNLSFKFKTWKFSDEHYARGNLECSNEDSNAGEKTWLLKQIVEFWGEKIHPWIFFGTFELGLTDIRFEF